MRIISYLYVDAIKVVREKICTYIDTKGLWVTVTRELNEYNCLSHIKPKELF